MINSRTLNFILIMVGSLIAIYANAKKQQEVYILLIGIMILMFGLYRVSRSISDKNLNANEDINLDEEE